LHRITRGDLLRGSMVPLDDERDVDTLRQISQLLTRENQRLVAANLELRAELARLRGEPEIAQLAFTVDSAAPPRTETPARAATPRPRPPQPGHGPREQPTLPIVETVHTVPADQRACPACGGTLVEMTGQYETADRITTVQLSYHVERHARQKYRCACNGAVVTAPPPPALISGGRYAPAFVVGVAVAKYADYLPLERQVRMMARAGLVIDSQTLWDQLNALARHLEPTYEALGQRALAAPVIAADETRWPRLGGTTPAAGTVWGIHAPTVASYRILPGKSAEEGRQLLGAYRGVAVVDGYAVYEVLARAGPDLTLAHCWAHTLRKYREIADRWPTACAEICTRIGELYAIERLVPGPFPGDADTQAERRRLRHEQSRPILDHIWTWATVQVGLPRSDFGKAVRYMVERWTGLTRFLDDPCIPVDNNAAYPARGINRGMPRAGLCRVAVRDPRMWRLMSLMAVTRAA
jgi:transposase